MKEIQLSRGKVAIVDDEDFKYLNQWKWLYYHKPGRNTGYAVKRQKNIDGTISLIRMHRIIMDASQGQILDHIDCNGLNNQKHNLRFCTSSQNKYNTRTRGGKMSGYKGVYWDSKNGNKKWIAKIKANGKELYIGGYPTKELAAKAYNEAALEYHGEFAKLNEVA